MSPRRYQLILRACLKLLGRIPLSPYETRVEVMLFLRNDVTDRQVHDVIQGEFEDWESGILETIVEQFNTTSAFSADLSRGKLAKLARLQHKMVLQALRERRSAVQLGVLRWKRNGGTGLGVA